MAISSSAVLWEEEAKKGRFKVYGREGENTVGDNQSIYRHSMWHSSKDSRPSTENIWRIQMEHSRFVV